MNLNQKPALRVEDFPKEQQDWLGALFGQVNPFFTSVNQILNQNVDFATNIPAVSNSYSINGFQKFGIQWGFTTIQPNSLIVNQAFNIATGVPTILLAAWSYDPAKSMINVTNMLEMTTSGNVALAGKYNFNIRVSV